jgi:hypothetical protein
MKAYRTYLTITNPGEVVISNVPFAAGQEVEVLLLVREKEQTSSLQQLDALLKKTQALPQVQVLTDEDIAAEIEAYRNGQ